MFFSKKAFAFCEYFRDLPGEAAPPDPHPGAAALDPRGLLTPILKFYGHVHRTSESEPEGRGGPGAAAPGCGVRDGGSPPG